MAYTAWSVIAGETPTASKWNILGTNDEDFDTRLDQVDTDKTMTLVPDASVITFDLALGKFFTTTLGGNRTLAVDNVATNLNKAFVVRLVQGSGGNKVPTWWSGIKWSSNVAPTLSKAEGAIDIFQFVPTDDDPATFDGLIVQMDLRSA